MQKVRAYCINNPHTKGVIYGERNLGVITQRTQWNALVISISNSVFEGMCVSSRMIVAQVLVDFIDCIPSCKSGSFPSGVLWYKHFVQAGCTRQVNNHCSGISTIYLHRRGKQRHSAPSAQVIFRMTLSIGTMTSLITACTTERL